MKIKKFTTLNEEVESNILFLFTKHQSDGDEYHHLFDTYETLFEYIICEIYYQLKNYPKALDDFDRRDFENDIEILLEYYEEISNKYKVDEIEYTEIEIEKEVKFEDWMKVRLNAKKFNI